MRYILNVWVKRSFLKYESICLNMYTLLLKNQLTADVHNVYLQFTIIFCKNNSLEQCSKPLLDDVCRESIQYLYQPAQRSSRRGRSMNSKHANIYVYIYTYHICIYLWVIIIIHDGNPLLWSHYNTFSAILNSPNITMVHIFGTIWGWLILEWWDYNPIKPPFADG